MSDEGYKIRDQNAIHFITFSVVQWIDVFTRKTYCDIIVDSLNFCVENKGLNVHAWCIMSNHLHLILSAIEGHQLSDLLRDFKKFTSYQLTKAIEQNPQESRKNCLPAGQAGMLWIFKKAGERNKRNENYQFWQQENHPVECSTHDILDSKMKYLHENPVRAGLVRFEGDYVYSSGIDYYCDEKGLVKIDYT